MSVRALTCQARLEALPEVLSLAETAAREAGADDSAAFDVRLAVEEVVTNVATHGYAGSPDPGELTVTAEAERGKVLVSIADRARPFVPEDAPPPDLDALLEDRPQGGLGWHLVRSVMDEVRHEARPGGGNLITLVKRTGGG